jgi:hypothetical protein
VVSDKHRTDPPQTAAKAVPAEEPVLPEVSGEDRDEGWGADPEVGRRDEQWYRRERPPHHE